MPLFRHLQIAEPGNRGWQDLLVWHDVFRRDRGRMWSRRWKSGHASGVTELTSRRTVVSEEWTAEAAVARLVGIYDGV